MINYINKKFNNFKGNFMNVVVCGGNGFIGSNLVIHLLRNGHKVTILDRNESQLKDDNLKSYKIDLLNIEQYKEEWFDGIDAVINLSGKDIITLWTKKSRKQIWDSRVTINKNLIDFMSRLSKRPKVFISASAVGYYGDKGDIEIDEKTPNGAGFLADLCVSWEEEARRAETLRMRSVQIRTAPVLLKNGGIMRQLMKTIRFGIGFIFGGGNNWFPWIHMKDIINIYEEVAINENISGPVNASSPNPVRFKDFVKLLKTYRKIIIIPLPKFLLRFLIGETADVLLFSQRVIPKKLQDHGYKFLFENLEDTFKSIFRS